MSHFMPPRFLTVPPFKDPSRERAMVSKIRLFAKLHDRIMRVAVSFFAFMERTLIAVFEICKPRGRGAAAGLAGLLVRAILSPSPFSSVGGGGRDPRRRAVCLHFRRRCRKLQTEREGEFQTAAEEEEKEGEGERGRRRRRATCKMRRRDSRRTRERSMNSLPPRRPSPPCSRMYLAELSQTLKR